MTTPAWSDGLIAQVSSFLSDALADEIETLVPPEDPLRAWWSPHPQETAVARLVALLRGGEDHLTLLALLAQGRSIAEVPQALDERIARELPAIAAAVRKSDAATSLRGETDAFVCYAHEDADRVSILTRLLADQGVRLFRDVERIRPGESITSRLLSELHSASSAVVVVSQASVTSEWVDRELDQLLARHRTGQATVLPVLVDDIPLPPSIADLFTIDLRGFRGEADIAWAAARLAPLAESIRLRRRGDPQRSTNKEGRRPWA